MKAHPSLTLPNCLRRLYPTWFRWKASSSPYADVSISVYIPHGSDESNSRLQSSGHNILVYIPHGSDERYSIRYLSRKTIKSFISHMVQMKGVFFCHCPSLNLVCLYPTWFRWKKSALRPIPTVKSAFISHMVQMKDGRDLDRDYSNLCRVYIPHGSDESSRLQSSGHNILVYIPHGSDERHIVKILIYQMWNSLYPTWFRWKEASSLLNAAMALQFISHMVQMKACFCYGLPSPPLVYIPHGSDERNTNKNKHVILLILFISHMVQMKVSLLQKKRHGELKFISHMVQMKGKRLWCCWHFTCLVYIPHGSDESIVFVVVLTLLALVYIPHGSDESRMVLSYLWGKNEVYIPHGSDERM